MISPIFLLCMSFIGIYLNVWFLLLTFGNKSKLYKSKKLSGLPSVSILIPAYNEAKVIGKTLRSVLSLDYPKEKIEVIAIDNGSSDGTSEVVRGFKDVKLIRLPKPGKVMALNAGLKHANGEIVGILDADTVVTKKCLKKMVGHFEDEYVGAVTNHIKVDSSKGFLLASQRVEYIFSALSKKLISFLDSMYITPGTLSLMRKRIVDKVGFSDDTLTEDMDVAICILKQGYRIVNCLDAVAYTRIPKTLKRLFDQRVRWYRGFIENLVKHSDILFNKKHLHLGFFILPFGGFMALLVGILFTGMLIWSSIYQFIFFFKNLLYIPLLDQISLALSDFLNPMALLITPYHLITYLIILTTSTITLFVSFKFLRVAIKKKRNILLVPFYFVVYYSLIMVFWFLSIFMEIFRWKKKW